MLLVDTSIWSDHLRRHDVEMARFLEAGEVLTHPFVIGELACGEFPQRSQTLALLSSLPSAPLLGQNEVLGFIERHGLMGKGVGLVDIHLLASARVAGSTLWTRDRRLAEAAGVLGVAFRRGH
jgi:predicted nucleic acid-binding protein